MEGSAKNKIVAILAHKEVEGDICFGVKCGVEHFACNCLADCCQHECVFKSTFIGCGKCKIACTGRGGEGEVTDTDEAYIDCTVVDYKVKGFGIVLVV